jgi:hypothetical protein
MGIGKATGLDKMSVCDKCGSTFQRNRKGSCPLATCDGTLFQHQRTWLLKKDPPAIPQDIS